MQIIDDLEPTKRGLYGGRGRLHRLLRQPRHGHRHPDHGGVARRPASVQAGAGIVADSDPGAEQTECVDKAAALLAAVPAARRATAGPAGAVSTVPVETGERHRAFRERDRRSTGPTAFAADYEALRHGAGVVPAGRDILRVAGPDAVSYLQGQCSQDVAALAWADRPTPYLLTPQGKLDALVRVTRAAEDELYVDVDAGFGPTWWRPGWPGSSCG